MLAKVSPLAAWHSSGKSSGARKVDSHRTPGIPAYFFIGVIKGAFQRTRNTATQFNFPEKAGRSHSRLFGRILLELMKTIY